MKDTATKPELRPLTPVEFGVLVDLACNANAPVGRVLQLGDLFQRAAALANQSDPVGVCVPVPVIPETTYADRHRLNSPVDTTFPA